MCNRIKCKTNKMCKKQYTHKQVVGRLNILSLLASFACEIHYTYVTWEGLCLTPISHTYHPIRFDNQKELLYKYIQKVTIMLGSETFRQQTKLSYSTPPYQKTELLMTAINLVFTCHHSIKHNFKGGTQLLIIESDLMLFLQTFQCTRGWSVFFKDRKVSQRKFQLP